MDNDRNILKVFVWIDTETNTVVDAGFYDTPPEVHFRTIGDATRCLPSFVGEVRRPTPQSPEIFGSCGKWLEQMPTIQWQLAWAACSGAPCYAAPNPPSTDISDGLIKV